MSDEEPSKMMEKNHESVISKSQGKGQFKREKDHWPLVLRELVSGGLKNVQTCYVFTPSSIIYASSFITLNMYIHTFNFQNILWLTRHVKLL